jgi:hypothetical protein
MAYFIIFTSRETEIRKEVEPKVEPCDTSISKILSLEEFVGKQKQEQNMKIKEEKNNSNGIENGRNESTITHQINGFRSKFGSMIA